MRRRSGSELKAVNDDFHLCNMVDFSGAHLRCLLQRHILVVGYDLSQEQLRPKHISCPPSDNRPDLGPTSQNHTFDRNGGYNPDSGDSYPANNCQLPKIKAIAPRQPCHPKWSSPPGYLLSARELRQWGQRSRVPYQPAYRLLCSP